MISKDNNLLKRQNQTVLEYQNSFTGASLADLGTYIIFPDKNIGHCDRSQNFSSIPTFCLLKFKRGAFTFFLCKFVCSKFVCKLLFVMKCGPFSISDKIYCSPFKNPIFFCPDLNINVNVV